MTGFLESVSSAGFFPGVLAIGWVIGQWSGNDRFSERLSIAPALGLMVWTGPMVIMAGLGLYRPWHFGLAGWIVTGLLVRPLFARPRGKPFFFDPVWLLVFVVAAAFGLWSFLYTGETFLGGRDQGGYANHALHIARTGSLWITFPFESFGQVRFGPMHFLQNLSNLGFTPEGMEAQFPPVYAVWMAQAVGVFGRMGVIGFNPVLAALTVPLFFGLARRFLDRPAALVALCVFLLAPTQIWMPRITLSEIAAQHFFIAAVLLITGGWLDRSVRAVVLGGFILGGVYWIRIDGLVAMPMIIIALAAVNALGPDDARSRALDTTLSIRLAVIALATMGVVSFSHYLTSSQYFLANSSKLGQIGLLTVLLIPVVFLCRTSLIREWANRFLGQRIVGLILIGLMVGLLAWAYWIRPFAEPFQLHPMDPGRGRSYREDSLVNVVAYLSKPGAILALLGLVAVLWALFRSRMERAWYLPLAIWGGYSALLLYDPHISPDHIWAMRRFVPVILPGCALFAGFGYAILARPIRRSPGRAIGAFVCCLILAGVMLPGSSVFAFFKENKGADTFLLELDSRVPADSLIFSDTGTLFFDPLYPGLGRRVVRVNLGDSRMPALIDEIIRENVQQGESVFFLVQKGGELLIDAERIDELVFEYEFIGPTTKPPPTERRRHVHHLSLIESKSAPHSVTAGLGNVTVGTRALAGIEESGFHGAEDNEFGPFRWTTDRWRLKIPLREDYRPRSVILNIGDLPPQGCELVVHANGAEIHRIFHHSAPGRLEIDLPADFDDSVLDLQVENDVFVPAGVEGRGTDQRMLGLMLYGVTLSDQPASKGTFELGIAPIPGVAEGGFHDPEVNEAGSYRWTDGSVWLELPLPAGYVVRAVGLTILDIPPGGTEIELLLDGDSVYRESFSAPPGEFFIDVKDFARAAEGDILRLDLRSGSFRPLDQGMGSDERVLGLRIHGITVTDRVR